MKKRCPVCNSLGVESSVRQYTGVRTVFGTKIAYEGVEDQCLDCGEAGDFDAANTPAIEKAFEAANRDGVLAVLKEFNETGFSDVSIERIMRLPIGTIKRWRNSSIPLPPEVAPLMSILTIKNLARMDA